MGFISNFMVCPLVARHGPVRTKKKRQGAPTGQGKQAERGAPIHGTARTIEFEPETMANSAGSAGS